MITTVYIFVSVIGLALVCDASNSPPLFKKPSLRFGTSNEEEDGMDHYYYTDAATADKITDLPNLDFQPNFQQFSGYLTVSEETNRNIFYWYVESQNDPKSDPLVFWTNGGPGCSGMIGFGSEHGPYRFSRNGTVTPNPYSWNKVANMFYVEQPAGVGFSFSDNKDDYHTGDEQAALDNYVLITKFFERFPERRQNDFYIASESYGGHYIPQLMEKILDHNDSNDFNFRGFLLGNPYVDPHSNDVTMYQAFYSHGTLSGPTFKKWHDNCADESGMDKNCDEYEKAMWKEKGDGINQYALDFDVCTDGKTDDTYESSLESSSSPSSFEQAFTLLQHRKGHIIGKEKSMLTTNSHRDLAVTYEPCENHFFADYINRNDVRNAIHVRDGLPRWSPCSELVKWREQDDGSIIDLYKKLIPLGLKKNLNMLVYSGDDDSICSTASTQYWIYDLGLDPEEGKLWQPWLVDGQYAGYVTNFDTGGESGNFTFRTVHSAGHEVPSYKPVEALELLKIFLKTGR